MEQKSTRALSNYVTDRNYYLDPALRRKMDVLAVRCSKYNHQNVMLTDGKEGYGKSTITATHAYYLAYQLKRKLRLFFNVDALSDDAKKNKDMVYIWDDAAISALTLEAYNREILKFIKVLLLARKKRHSYFINIQEIFRLKEPIISRAIGLTRVYSPDKIHLGKFVHYMEANLSRLYYDWVHKKSKNYNLHYDLRGNFPNVLYDIFDEKEYEELKDISIESIGEERVRSRADSSSNKWKQRYDYLRRKISEMNDKFSITQTELSKHLGITQANMTYWKFAGTGEDVDLISYKREGVISKKVYIEPKPIELVKPSIIVPQPIPIIVSTPSRKIIRPQEESHHPFL